MMFEIYGRLIGDADFVIKKKFESEESARIWEKQQEASSTSAFHNLVVSWGIRPVIRQ